MNNKQNIRHLFAEGKPLVSLEFFPPKDEAGGKRLIETAEILSTFKPDFVSITYGAGGGTRKTTMEYAKLLKENFGFEVMPHLTCVGHTKNEILEILEDFADAGFSNIMALRGDPPKGEKIFKPISGGFAYASELVSLIKEHFPHFGIGVGGYPEKHPEANSMKIDLTNLKTKVDAGADFITTQLFFDNQAYHNFVDQCRSMNISIPILPGLLPVLSFEQVQRFCKMCEANLPKKLEELLENSAKENQAEVGANWALEQIKGLLNAGSPGFHLYALNKSDSTLRILNGLRKA